MSKIKIVSYNLNGIRAAVKRGLLTWLEAVDADIICFQETRANEDVCREIFSKLPRYHATLNCGTRAGYSGTAILSKIPPNHFEFGLDADDPEGRLITAFFENFAVVDCYVPNGGSRLEYKMNYAEKLNKYLIKLARENNVIFCSDTNTAHEEIDVSHPTEAAKATGFLKQERAVISELLNNGFVDSFRELNPKRKQFSWRSYFPKYLPGADWQYRFDYIIVNEKLKNKLISSDILDLNYSDHLPVVTELESE